MLSRYWYFISHFRIEEGTSVLERKRLVLINQMIFVAMLGWTVYAGYLLVAYFYLIHLDYARYAHYFKGGVIFIVIWLLLIGAFFLRPKNSDSFLYYFAVGVFTGVGLATSSIFYGQVLALELGVLVIMMGGVVSMLNERRKWVWLLPTFMGPSMYFLPKIWFLFYPEIYPMDAGLLRVSYFIWHVKLGETAVELCHELAPAHVLGNLREADKIGKEHRRGLKLAGLGSTCGLELVDYFTRQNIQ